MNTVRLKLYGGMILIVLVSVFLVKNTTSHVDLQNFCFISIKQGVRQNDRAPIKQALTVMRETHEAEYKVLCEYVDTINSKRCKIGDPRVDASIAHIDPPGCYVRGSHTVYLKPSSALYQPSVAERVNHIIEYSTYSRDFWVSIEQKKTDL